MGRRLKSTWTAVLACIVTAAVPLWPSWMALHGIWTGSSRYSHGYAILLFGVALLLREKVNIEKHEPAPWLPGLLFLLLSGFLWLIAVAGGIQSAHIVLAPVIVWLACLSVLGWSVARNLILPFSFFYFAIPVWESGNFLLQFITVQLLRLTLSLLSVPAYIEGNFVQLPNGVFEIAGGCSGLHYLLVGLALSVLYAAFYLRPFRVQVSFVAIVAIASVLINCIRVTIIIYAGYRSGMTHYLVSEEHYLFGWILYVLCMIPVFLFAGRWDRPVAGSFRSGSGAGFPPSLSSAVSYVMLSCISLVVLTITFTLQAQRPASGIVFAGEAFPENIGEWQRSLFDAPEWSPYFLNPDEEESVVYVKLDDEVAVYRNFYSSQKEGKEVIAYENRLAGAGDWNLSQRRPAEIGDAAVREWPVAEAVTESPGGVRYLLYFWYQVDGRPFVSEGRTKVYYGFRRLFGQPSAGIVVVSSRCSSDCQRAQGAIRDWIHSYRSAKSSITAVSQKKEQDSGVT